ncbi:MAG: formyltetrahydrofolate deformylase [Arenicella sp.]
MTQAVNSEQTYILTATCPSLLGTVNVVTSFLFDNSCYIIEINSYDDTSSGCFFIRAEFKSNGGDVLDIETVRQNFSTEAQKFDMSWKIRESSYKERLVLMVSKFDHCLEDLLHRYRTQELNVEIPAIISNHPDLKPLADWHRIPYHHFPITADTKAHQEAKVWQVVQDVDADLVVLARYMQVLSDDMCKNLQGKAINIHHSLLPGFKGAKPYHQAFDKGVKLVGATAHYVSEDLDEGPIISQGFAEADHSDTAEKLVAKGRDIERLTLAKALKLHCEGRVFLNGTKTVIL